MVNHTQPKAATVTLWDSLSQRLSNAVISNTHTPLIPQPACVTGVGWQWGSVLGCVRGGGAYPGHKQRLATGLACLALMGHCEMCLTVEARCPLICNCVYICACRSVCVHVMLVISVCSFVSSVFTAWLGTGLTFLWLSLCLRADTLQSEWAVSSKALQFQKRCRVCKGNGSVEATAILAYSAGRSPPVCRLFFPLFLFLSSWSLLFPLSTAFRSVLSSCQGNQSESSLCHHNFHSVSDCL